MTVPPPPRPSRRWKLAAAIGVAALVQIGLFVVVFSVILHSRGSDEPEPAEDWATQADGVVAAIEAIADDPSALVAEDVRSDLQVEPASVIDPASMFAARRESWVPDGIGGGVIEVTMSDGVGTATDYLAVMVKEGDQWKVLSTIRIR